MIIIIIIIKINHHHRHHQSVTGSWFFKFDASWLYPFHAGPCRAEKPDRVVEKRCVLLHESGQIITTSHDQKPPDFGSFLIGKWGPLLQRNLDW